MIIVEDIKTLPDTQNGRILMIGNFDGFHRGHQALLDTARARARDTGAHLAALTPSPHPRLFFEPERPLLLLTPGRLKYRMMSRYGLESAIAPRFDARFAAMEPEEFIEALLINQLDTRHVVVGEGFRFGRRRRGDTDMLIRLARRRGCGVTVHPPVMVAGGICSSSRIRNCIRDRRTSEAERLLGHPLPVTRNNGIVRAMWNRSEPRAFQTQNERFHVDILGVGTN